MAHKPHQQLLDEIAAASEKIQIDARYTHYKGQDKIYKVLHFATLEADDSLCVVYQVEYGDKLLFVRPVTSWLETVEWEGKTLPRFTPVA